MSAAEQDTAISDIRYIIEYRQPTATCHKWPHDARGRLASIVFGTLDPDSSSALCECNLTDFEGRPRWILRTSPLGFSGVCLCL